MAEAPHPDPRETSPSDPTLFVVTIFEDQTAADCAHRLMRRILEMAGPIAPVQEYAWGFDMFDQPDGLVAAARRAASADVLVVAAHHDSPAVSRVVQWLQHWLGPVREKRGALVAITVELEDTVHTSSLNEERLLPVARQIDMDFFSTRVPAIPDFTEGEYPSPQP